MKTKYFVLAALVSVSLFASCNKENSKFENEEGEPTSMKLSISFPRAASTRATYDPNAKENETKIYRIDVFIYTASGAFSSHSELLPTDLKAPGKGDNADVYEVTDMIPVTTGTKTIFVGLNMPASIVDNLKNKPASALATTAQTLTHEQLTGYERPLWFPERHTGFAMFSKEGVTSKFVKDENAPANNITVTCQRLAAKITVEKASSLLPSEAEQKEIYGGFFMKNTFFYYVFNNNTRMYLLQGAPEARKDPNWAIGSYVEGDFTSLTTEPETNGGMSFIKSTDEIDNIALYDARYAAENTSEGKLKKEATCVVVMAQFVPSKFTKFDGADFYQIDNPKAHPNPFYMVSLSPVEHYFFDWINRYDEFGLEDLSLVLAKQFADAKGVPRENIKFYNGGLNYWDIYLNKNPNHPANRWDVLRNDYYRCTITKIKSIGRPVPDLPDPDAPIETDTKIEVSIEVLDWSVVGKNIELE